jgi:two-component system sensor histidine kinase HydH
MRWQTWTTLGVVMLALALLAWWQHREYLRERDLARETVYRQSHSVMNALVGGIRAHRRRGRYFEGQLQESLEELVKSQDILAVAVTSDDGRLALSAGKSDLLHTKPPVAAGEFWDEAGFRLVEKFELSAAPGGFFEAGGRGGGRGRGRGPSSTTAVQDDPESPFSVGGRFAATLVLDRSQTDDRCQRAAWLRGSVVAAGALVLFCVTLAWHVTVRAAGRARVLEAEARHLRNLSQAAAGLAHDTRNPLGLIRGWTQRLTQANLGTAEQQDYAHAVVEECDRITSRINQFLAFAKPCEPSPETVDPADVIGQLRVLLQPDLENKDLKLECSVAIPGTALQADPEMLREALFNLIQNAIQFSPENQTVEIFVTSGQDGTRRIDVADRGPGVAEDAVDSLFTPYFTTRSDGTGLGLAIVRRIAVAHGWRVKYLPRPGGGAIFRLDRIRA